MLPMLCGLLISAACAAKPAAPKTINVYEGTGRACAGQLAITPKTISWQTSFSQCPKTAYELVKNEPNLQVYRMQKRAKTCAYDYIQVETGLPNEQVQVIGFPNQQAFAEQNTVDGLSCMVVQDDHLSK